MKIPDLMQPQGASDAAEDPSQTRARKNALEALAREERAIRGRVPPEWGLSRRETAGFLQAHGVTPQAVEHAGRKDAARARHPLVGMFLASEGGEHLGEVVDVVDLLGGVFLLREYGVDPNPTLPKVRIRTVAPGWYAQSLSEVRCGWAHAAYQEEVAAQERFPEEVAWDLRVGNPTPEDRYQQKLGTLREERAREAVAHVVARGGLPYIEAQISIPEPCIRYETDNHRYGQTGVPTAVFDGYEGWSGRVDARGRRRL